MIGVLTGNLGSIGDFRRRIALLATTAALLCLAPASAFAADPATHQYGSNLTQICVDGEIVTTGGAGGGQGAGAGLTEACGGGVGGGGVVGGQGVGGAGAPGTADSTAVGSLPFTGLDVGLLAAVAVALLAGGLFLRRRRSAPLEA